MLKNVLCVAMLIPPHVRDLHFQPTVAPDTVVVRNGGVTLRGLMWRPTGSEPFPAILFNHGSWPKINGRPARAIYEQANTLGPVFARHGYAFLFLFRRGVGLSVGQGSHVGDVMESELAKNGQEARHRAQLRLLETDELSDALAGMRFLRELHGIDSRRVAVVGHSFGGMLTLLMAERDRTLPAAVAFGAAAANWEQSPKLRARLIKAVDATTVPIFFIHAANDYSTAPGKTLAAEMARLRKPHYFRIYPAFGTTASEGHNLIHGGVSIWESDVFNFLDGRLRSHVSRKQTATLRRRSLK